MKLPAAWTALVARPSCVVLACVLAMPAFGQDSRQDPTKAGQLERRIDETVPDRDGRRDIPKEAPETLTVPQAVPGPSAAQFRFTLAAVSIMGASVFTPAELAPLYEPFLATPITDVEATEIARRITRKYVDAGYILSQAIVPAQQVVTGVLHLRVIEGYVADVRIAGVDPGRIDVAPYARNIMAARPLRLSVLERNILLIADNAGVTVEGSRFDAGDGNGAYGLALDLSYDRIDAYAYADNRGTPSVGRSQLWLSAGINQPVGLGERLQAGVFTVPTQPQELQYGELRYSQPIGGDGLQATGLVSYSRIDAGSDQALNDTVSDTRRGILQLAYPVIRARRTNLWLNGFFDYRDSSEDQFGQLNYDDRLRVARVRANLTFRDDWQGTNWAIGTLSRGLDIFGASSPGAPFLSRPDGDPQFTKLYLDIGRVQDVGSKYAIEVSSIGQLSNEPLLSSEEIGLGGSRFGRAYDFAEITGDDGLAGSIEIRRLFAADDPHVDDVQLYGFFDIGAVWNRNAASAEFSRQSLASAGVGLRATLYESASAGIEVAKPLTRPVFTSDNDNGLRVFVSLSASF